MSLKLLRLLPVLSTTVSLMFAVDEDIFFRTWMNSSFRDRANAHLPAWFFNWGRRGRWVIIISYPFTWSITLLNLLMSRAQLQTAGAEKWYWLGLVFSAAHMLYGMKALRLLDMIKRDVPKGNCTESMGEWLTMNWQRAVLTDLPAWGCMIVGFLAAVELK